MHERNNDKVRKSAFKHLLYSVPKLERSLATLNEKFDGLNDRSQTSISKIQGDISKLKQEVSLIDSSLEPKIKVQNDRLR